MKPHFAAAVLLALLGLASAPLLLVAGAVHADCTTSSDVMLNEVFYADGAAPMGGHVHPIVELFNRGPAVSLAGWTLTDAGAGVRATLPAVTLPSQAFLLIHFGTGDDDLDFADGIGVLFTNGDSVGVFDRSEDGIGLYDGTPGAGSLRDFVGWSETGMAPAGLAVSDAVAAGRWPSGGFVPAHAAMGLFSIRLVPDGYDHDLDGDWRHRGWDELGYGANLAGRNPLEIGPVDGGGAVPGSVSFSWTALDSALYYRLQVATDPTFASGVLVDAEVAGTDTTLAGVAQGGYFWRVAPVDRCGEATLGGIELLVLADPDPDNPNAKRVSVTRRFQRKDSKLLCIWSDKPKLRPGCDETGTPQGPWDGTHAEKHAQDTLTITVGNKSRRVPVSCPHCRYYCGRASVQMLNQFHGGTLSQDRISYQWMTQNRALAGVAPAPEGDLGHGVGTPSDGTAAVLAWAIPNGVVFGRLAPNYDAIRAELVAGRPIMAELTGLGAGGINHVVVIDGFVDTGAYGDDFPTSKLIHVTDPWPSGAAVNGWVKFSKLDALSGWWRVQPAGPAALAGRLEEPTVSADTDLDGVVDFDEADRFPTVENDPDSDNDDVKDKMDIRSYTFYTCAGNDALLFPDVDGDGMRAEVDCDSDNGGLFDGGEDIRGAGVCNLLTNPFVAAGDAIAVKTDKSVYFPGEEVKLSGATFHADTTYPIGTLPLCPTYQNGDPVATGGSVTTNAVGAIPEQTVTFCAAPAVNHIIVDVIRNNRYEAPRCRNPYTCWSCVIGPLQPNHFNHPPLWPVYPIVTVPPGSPAWQFVPDGGHQNTGFLGEMNGYAVPPGQPFNTALRMPPCQTPPGATVMLRFWTHFESQGAQGRVRISLDNGAAWQDLMVLNPMSPFEGYVGIDLTPLLGGASATDPGTEAAGAPPPPFLLEFLMMGVGGSGLWKVDDVFTGHMPPPAVSVPSPAPEEIPSQLALLAGEPNPFRERTVLRYAIPAPGGKVALEIFDVAGRRVRSLVRTSRSGGWYHADWDGRGDSGARVPRGLYFIRLATPGGMRTQRLLFVE